MKKNLFEESNLNELEFRNLLKTNITTLDYNIYLQSAEIDIYTDSVNIYMPNNFSKKQLENKYLSVIKKLENVVNKKIYLNVA